MRYTEPPIPKHVILTTNPNLFPIDPGFHPLLTTAIWNLTHLSSTSFLPFRCNAPITPHLTDSLSCITTIALHLALSVTQFPIPPVATKNVAVEFEARTVALLRAQLSNNVTTYANDSVIAAAGTMVEIVATYDRSPARIRQLANGSFNLVKSRGGLDALGLDIVTRAIRSEWLAALIVRDVYRYNGLQRPMSTDFLAREVKLLHGLVVRVSRYCSRTLVDVVGDMRLLLWKSVSPDDQTASKANKDDYEALVRLLGYVDVTLARLHCANEHGERSQHSEPSQHDKPSQRIEPDQRSELYQQIENTTQNIPPQHSQRPDLRQRQNSHSEPRRQNIQAAIVTALILIRLEFIGTPYGHEYLRSILSRRLMQCLNERNWSQDETAACLPWLATIAVITSDRTRETPTNHPGHTSIHRARQIPSQADSRSTTPLETYRSITPSDKSRSHTPLVAPNPSTSVSRLARRHSPYPKIDHPGGVPLTPGVWGPAAPSQRSKSNPHDRQKCNIHEIGGRLRNKSEETTLGERDGEQRDEEYRAYFRELFLTVCSGVYEDDIDEWPVDWQEKMLERIRGEFLWHKRFDAPFRRACARVVDGLLAR